MSCVIVDLTGREFGNLKVIRQAGRSKEGQVMWLCQCQCGEQVTVSGGNLRRTHGNISCGCARKARIGLASFKHGLTTNGRPTKEYQEANIYRRRLRKYGITEEEHKALKEIQNFRCAICGVDPTNSKKTRRDLHIDHDHVTGAVRGLLCHNCNVGIGLLMESEVILQSSIEYLRRHKAPFAQPSVSEGKEETLSLTPIERI